MCTSWCSASMELTKSGIRSRENRIYYTHAARKVFPNWRASTRCLSIFECDGLRCHMLTNMTYTRAAHWEHGSDSSAKYLHITCTFYFESIPFLCPFVQLYILTSRSSICFHQSIWHDIRYFKSQGSSEAWSMDMDGASTRAWWKASEETGKECIGAKRSTYKAILFKFNIGSYSEESMKVVVGIATRDERDNIVLAFYIVPTVFLLLSNNDKTFCLGSVGRIRTVGRHRR